MEIADRYSDFVSCKSSDDTDSGTSDKNLEDGFQIQGRKKKKRVRKHKLSPSPPNDLAVKKLNRGKSPENFGAVDVVE